MGNCAIGDPACICAESNFQDGWACCVNTGCNEADEASAIGTMKSQVSSSCSFQVTNWFIDPSSLLVSHFAEHRQLCSWKRSGTLWQGTRRWPFWWRGRSFWRRRTIRASANSRSCYRHGPSSTACSCTCYGRQPYDYQ
ncbi:MAG: hypothetical protein CL912_31785 [Deltaproteobacteria bacterium]|nr:hypothetical protein [Deltaproteobacteria bacterium]